MINLKNKYFIEACLFAFFLGAILWGASLTGLCQQKQEDDKFIAEEMAWRTERDKGMRSPTSWLTIAGLFWLEEGENTFGASAENKIKLPKESAPEFAGKFIFENGKITVIANPGVELKVRDTVINQKVLETDDTGSPDIISLNDLRIWIIKRAELFGVRLRDLNAPAFINYKGLDFFPPSREFKLEADYIPYETPKKVQVDTMIKIKTELNSPGYIKFTIDGKEFSLEAFQGSNEKSLFIIFKDETNGNETYEASRFLNCKIMENGKVDLNFNRAYNPPCAYTLYATCPLPPPQNYLNIRIEAGEKKYPQSIH